MSERLNRGHLEDRAANVNRRLEGTGRRVEVQSRNGHTGLDEWKIETRIHPGGFSHEHWSCVRTITVGTKREVGEFLHAMMVGIDLSRTNA